MKILILFLFFILSINKSTADNHVEIENATTEKIMIHRSSVDENRDIPKETQMAQCTVQSGDIKASAQATFSKKLEGFCSTRDMKELKENLIDMEARLYKDIYKLQLMIEKLLPYNSQYRQYPSARDDYYRNNDFEEIKYKSSFNDYASSNKKSNYDNYYPQRTTYKSVVTEPTTTTSTKMSSTSSTVPPVSEKSLKVPIVANQLKSLETPRIRTIRKQQENVQSTSTIKPTKIFPKNEYTYYWKLDNFPKAFHHAKKHEIYSHVFNVKGLFLRIRAVLNKFENENLIIDVEHLANIDNSEKLEIEISDGLVFKEIADEKLFQYSFSIIDQLKPNHDLVSPIYWNTDDDNFLIPNSVHLLSNYLKDNSVLIKLVITF